VDNERGGRPCGDEGVAQDSKRLTGKEDHDAQGGTDPAWRWWSSSAPPVTCTRGRQ